MSKRTWIDTFGAGKRTRRREDLQAAQLTAFRKHKPKLFRAPEKRTIELTETEIVARVRAGRSFSKQELAQHRVCIERIRRELGAVLRGARRARGRSRTRARA